MVVVYVKFLFNPFIFSGFVSAFIASICWTMAMTKFEITYAYPFICLSPAMYFY
jgi:undecaprenyl phosphate-alpha-L-ara4N flippase subunit ArnF